jgi:signal transduction histidine kinase
MLRTVIGSRIQIVTDVGYELWLDEADASQLETALVNMAVNARDAMDGEGTLTIRQSGSRALCRCPRSGVMAGQAPS